MKKILLVAVAFLGFVTISNAQEISENAIGLRIGGDDGFGAEVSYQRALGDNNRLELDLGLRSGDDYNGFKLAGIYQWVWNIDGGFNWYAGPGAGLASYKYDKNNRFGPNNEKFEDSQTYIFIGGQVGIEYNFDIPLMLSLDVRPEFGLGKDNSFYSNNDLDLDIALSVRYKF